jgi:hypothetical protein
MNSNGKSDSSDVCAGYLTIPLSTIPLLHDSMRTGKDSSIKSTHSERDGFSSLCPRLHGRNPVLNWLRAFVPSSYVYCRKDQGRGERFGLPAGRLFVGGIANSDLRQFQLTFNTNFWGPVRVLQAALPLMPNTGNVIIFNSKILDIQLLIESM